MNAVIRVLLPIAVIAGAVAIFIGLKASKPEAKKVPRVDRGALVETKEIQVTRQLVQVEARGTVRPAREVVLGSEVGGRVVWMHKELVPGGRLLKGQRLIKIDARDYSLAVEQSFAAVDRAQTELEIEHGRKKIAEREWELFGNKSKTANPAGSSGKESLALREPQMRTARVALKSAESGLRRAKLTVSKTVINTPFNAIVHLRNVEMGQMVGPATPLVTLVGTDTYWVQVSIPVDRLAWISIPGIGGATHGSRADVVQTVGKERIVREGHVVRLLGDVDPAGRMARVLVEIKDPLGLERKVDVGTERPQASMLPLLIGSYVEVAIDGREVDDVVIVSRAALRDNDTVYLYRPDNTLEIREVDVLWRRPDEVLVTGGLKSGELLITSPLSSPIVGMKIRTKASSEKAAPPEPGPEAKVTQ